MEQKTLTFGVFKDNFGCKRKHIPRLFGKGDPEFNEENILNFVLGAFDQINIYHIEGFVYDLYNDGFIKAVVRNNFRKGARELNKAYWTDYGMDRESYLYSQAQLFVQEVLPNIQYKTKEIIVGAYTKDQ